VEIHGNSGSWRGKLQMMGLSKLADCNEKLIRNLTVYEKY
jgi:hypothetical protein